MGKNLSNILNKLEATKPFSESEAWFLYRCVAIGEAFGWTVLIAGVLINKYKLVGYKVVLPIAGQVHGTLFIAYFGVLIATYTSLGWSRKNFFISILAGVPPFGSLMFERWISKKQFNTKLKQQYYSLTLARISKNIVLSK